MAAVIIPVWNGAGYLPACLDALLRQEGLAVIVVDNGSADGSAELVRRRYPQVQLVENGRNLGFAGGCNVGLRLAKAETLFLVNQDVVVQPGWLAALQSALAQPGVGVVGCKLLYPDGTIQHAGGALRYPLAHPDHFGYRQPDRGEWDEPRDVEYVSGAAMGLRRALLDEIGFLDEGFYPAFYEDTDFCRRARAAGYRVVYVPQAVALHHETTTVEREGVEYHRWMGRGRLRYVLKHYSPEQFPADFVPAERAWLAALESPAMRQGMWMAYLDTLLGLREALRAGCLAAVDEEDEVAELLLELRAQLIRAPAPSRPEERIAGIDWRVEERPFASRVPLVGPLVAAFRSLWNGVSTRWYVRPLLEQQNAVNRQLAEAVAALQETMVELDREAVDARRLNARSIHRLREELERLQAREEMT
ncbi:MAG: glycosyltransferase family 2 protein [Anaerolineae bacterium]|nr:glycosyltransferase family 2 protein [Anaerolineae bacterium]